MTYRSIVLPVGALLVFGGLMFAKWFGDKQMNAFFDNMPEPPVTISSAQVQQGRWPREVETVGTFAAVNGAQLATEASGIVDDISFKNGSAVKAGEIILRLNTDIEVAELNALEAAARLAEIELERVRSLYESNNVSRAEVDIRQTQADQARANLDAQRARVEQKTIVAPVSGVLGIRQVNLGQYVEAGSAIVTLQSLDPIFLNFMLPEQRLTDISAGQLVTAHGSAFADEPFHGVVTAIEPRVEQSTRNFMIQATIDNPDGHLRPGMFARVELAFGAPQEVLTVPQTAINFNPYGNSVYVIREARVPAQSPPPGNREPAPAGSAQATEQPPRLTVVQRFIRTGARRGDLISVTDGLRAGERVATSGLLKLRNEAVVNINNKIRPEADVSPTPPNS
ncbi:MAG: efflux RND transporter periplasmic adaptor subunit [Gammaproteobacteria bacterium]|nr:efflux RND transporter periplasmic adaptor subunit [Gammaproteobacteria bacterium]